MIKIDINLFYYVCSTLPMQHNKSSFIDSDEELKNVTELRCNNLKLSSFEGLNAPKLKKLYCYDNDLTSFEGLNTPLLRILNCYGNNISSFK